MKSVFKYASALLLGAAGMFVYIHTTKHVLNGEEYWSLKGTEHFTKYFNATPQGIAINQRNLLCDIIHNHFDRGCPTIINDVRMWCGGVPFEALPFKDFIKAPVTEDSVFVSWGFSY